MIKFEHNLHRGRDPHRGRGHNLIYDPHGVHDHHRDRIDPGFHDRMNHHLNHHRSLFVHGFHRGYHHENDMSCHPLHFEHLASLFENPRHRVIHFCSTDQT